MSHRLVVPKEAEQAKQLGNVLFAKEKFNAAIEAYTEARLLCPKWPVPLVNRALCNKKLCKWDALAADCQAALALDPELPKAEYMLGLSFLEKQQYKLSEQHLQKALDLARNKGATMLDEIWKELARAKYALWLNKNEAVQTERRALLEVTERAIRHAYDDLSKEEAPVASSASSAGLEATLAAMRQVFRDANKDNAMGEIPDWCTCRLTMEPFRDPVQTTEGFTYERSALFNHFKKLGHFDPVTRGKVNPDLCVSNIAVRVATQAYLDSHGW
eukprot:CAMPEP_0198197556 /NCGR_PEP_ID=MMETSP1445-20131203/1134_1 /TAXON_ID=36898 /ORGANISM="Pyramimonas sp., Strain CCMP2087" /LENGTH=272 /DNA_ID=CAMNT_0043866869 /DNA_START=253 /DNA_END=1068 /DNA_ORIENTATION=-